MKKLFLSVSLFFMALVVATAQETIRVNSAEQLIRAISSNTTITIEKDSKIDFSTVFSKKSTLKKLNIKVATEKPSGEEAGLFLFKNNLYICGFQSLAIVGESGVELLADTAYMPFICFNGVQNLTIKNLKFKQKSEVQCKDGQLCRVAAMLSFGNCESVAIDNCVFSMSNAAYALGMSNSRGISVENSVFEGSKKPSSIMSIFGGVEKLTFSKCLFTKCSENKFITGKKNEPIVFYQCAFTNNEGELFTQDFEPIELILEQCKIDHPMEQVNIDHIKDIDSQWSGNRKAKSLGLKKK